MSKSNNDKKKNKWLLYAFLIAIIVIAVVGILIYKGKKDKEKEITYNQLYQDIIDYMLFLFPCPFVLYK